MYQQPIKCVYEKGGNISLPTCLNGWALDLILMTFSICESDYFVTTIRLRGHSSEPHPKNRLDGLLITWVFSDYLLAVYLL